MKRIIRIALVLVILAAVSAAGVWYYRNHTATASASSKTTSYTQVVKVTQGNLSSTVSVVGALEAQQSASLSFSKMTSTAKLASLAIKTGATVTIGQVLATINPATYQQARDQAERDLAAAVKKLADLKTPATALAIARADLAIAKAQLQIQQAQNALDDLVSPDMTSLEADVASAQSAVAKSEADVVALPQDQTYKDNLYRLTNAAATPTANYNRLQAENTPDSDIYYLDRLQIAYNKAITAQDAQATLELQQQISIVQAQMTLRKNKAALVTAQEALAAAKAGGDKLALAKAQVAVTEAKVALQSAQKARADLNTGTDATTIAAAQADVDKKTLTLSDAEAALAGATMTAPFDGTILQTNVKAGDQVAANTTILTIADLKTLRVAASIDETTIRQISAGQTTVITFDAYPNQQFQGKVLEVPLQGALQGGVMVYVVPISLSGAEKISLLVGMTANVKIQAGSVSNALLIPTLALTRASGQYQVQVPNTSNPAGDPETVPVEVGLSTGAYTQITKGLNAGDQVIVNMTKTATSTNTSRTGAMGGIFGMFGIR